MSEEEAEKKPRRRTAQVRVVYGFYSWDDEDGVHHEAAAGDVIRFPVNSSMLKQGLASGKFEKVTR